MLIRKRFLAQKVNLKFYKFHAKNKGGRQEYFLLENLVTRSRKYQNISGPADGIWLKLVVIIKAILSLNRGRT